MIKYAPPANIENIRNIANNAKLLLLRRRRILRLIFKSPIIGELDSADSTGSRGRGFANGIAIGNADWGATATGLAAIGTALEFVGEGGTAAGEPGAFGGAGGFRSMGSARADSNGFFVAGLPFTGGLKAGSGFVEIGVLRLRVLDFNFS